MFVKNQTKIPKKNFLCQKKPKTKPNQTNKPTTNRKPNVIDKLFDSKTKLK